MAKSRRLAAKPTKIQAKTESFSPALPSESPAAASQAPLRRSTYVEAVAIYERGLEAIQRHDFNTAMDLLGGHLDPGYSQSEDATFINSLLSTLPAREREVLRLRFELELTQAEIGERLGLSQMHISRLIRKSITRLQAAAQV